jgi:hypothetical protein
LDRSPGATARPGVAARFPLRRRIRERQARPCPRRDLEPARRCARDLRPARGRLDVQHPRHRCPPHAAAALVRHRAARGPPDPLCRRRQAQQRSSSPAGGNHGGARARRLHSRSRDAWRGAPHGAARPGHRCRRAVPHHHRFRGKGDPGRRSDRDDEGSEEPGRDRGRARGAPARWRRGVALPRLARTRGAGRPAHRNRCGRGVGELPPRQRPAEGRLILHHRRRDRTARSSITASRAPPIARSSPASCS